MKECAALVVSALIGGLRQRCVGDGASVAKQHVQKEGGGQRGQVSLTGSRFLHLLPLPLLLLSLENIQRNT